MIAFGPVPSRRLGKSLGINNVPSSKVCSYGCVYCQIGPTSRSTLVREHFFEPEKMLKEVEGHLKKLDENHVPDYLTFVSNGEPTLDLNLGREIRLLGKIGIPIAVITNASLLHIPQVQTDLMEADWVSLKVDTTDEDVWKRLNRPAKGLDFGTLLSGLISFAGAYRGKLHTETMLVSGFNDNLNVLRSCADFIASMKPQKAYLSIPIRPPAVKGVNPVPEKVLTGAWQIYNEAGLSTELMAGFEGTDTGTTGNAFEDILNITAVHPLREDSLAALLEKDHARQSVVDSLIAQGLIRSSRHNGKIYYVRNYHIR